MIKMLIQTDNLIVDLHKNGTRFGPSISDDVPHEDQRNPRGDIRGLDWTIHCNGKIKRHRTFFNTEKISNLEDPDHIQVQNWLPIYEATQLLKDLGYDIDDIVLNQKIDTVIQLSDI